MTYLISKYVTTINCKAKKIHINCKNCREVKKLKERVIKFGQEKLKTLRDGEGFKKYRN